MYIEEAMKVLKNDVCVGGEIIGTLRFPYNIHLCEEKGIPTCLQQKNGRNNKKL